MRNKKSFAQGALTGALAMLLVAVAVNGFLLWKNSGKSGKNEKTASVVEEITEEKLEIIQGLIKSNYFYEDEIDEKELQEYLVRGYVAGLGDPYSVYYNEEETKELMESTTGEFEGIGVVIMQDTETGLVTVSSVYKDSPGEKAGLRAGDIFYKVDGKEVQGEGVDEVAAKIRGKKGTKVEITVLRGEDLEEHVCTATRDVIEVNTVSYEIAEDNIGYLQISGFENVTTEQFQSALEDLEKQGMKKLVVDLRNNPGGTLTSVCEILDLILPEGTIVYTMDKQNIKQLYTSDEEHQIDIPMVVLVNGNSASASEIFAGALQDYKKATIMGTTTYGKGIVQNIFQLSDGTALKLTISEYFTPNDRSIHGTGIAPDVEVEYVYDAENPDYDNQLQEAIKLLKEK